jgi:hypothetical protein
MFRYQSIFGSILLAASLMMFGTAQITHAAVGCNNDSNVQAGEDCDNGPNIIADGCDDNCEVLTGWACVNPGGSDPSECHQIVCGDVVVDPGEDCEVGPCCNEDCTFTQAETVCRGAAGDCDLIEYCSGISPECPIDDKSTDVCRPAVSPECDVEESCDGDSVDCPADVLANACDDGDGLDCTESTCLENGDCVHADTCVETCRGPGFYQTHGGEEKESTNVVQEILDDVGGILVCGEFIDETVEVGQLSSALEGLCMRTQGVEQRQLYRQLLTARLNCALSEGDDCDSITGRFIDVSYDDCDALCAGETVVDGPTEDECIDALKCFNSGGRVVNDECITGTCNGEDVINCFDDEDCADEIECVRFEDSCSNSSLCTEDLDDAEAQICPEKGPASSPKLCRAVRHNACTIDDTMCWKACEEFEPCVAACDATPGCDPVVACTTQAGCFQECIFGGGFNGSGDCGCEYSHAFDCYFSNIGDEGAYIDCLRQYPFDEALGDYCYNIN